MMTIVHTTRPTCYTKECVKNYTKFGLCQNFKKADDKNLTLNYDFYYETLSKNDPKFLAPVRRWEKRMGFVTPIRWPNALAISLFHVLIIIAPLYYLYLGLRPTWQTVLLEVLWGGVSGFGVTGGVHRYWTHRSFKAKMPLRVIFIIAFSMAGQNDIVNWVRDHRVHHRMGETSADPHDVRRGFFFSHIGWLMMKKHPLVIAEGQKVDMSDIVNDPVVKFHTKYFTMFKMVLCFLLPSVIKLACWDEAWETTIISTLIRYILSLHFTWSVNSFAHLWGNKPYDINIMPVENLAVSMIAMGEGWHNYHHTFPWDYKTAELAYFFNLTTFYIDLFARLGWAYDLKKASPSLIQAVVKNRGPNKDSVKSN